MARSLARLVMLATMAATTACGAGAPREADIYHDPALRPGSVAAADDAERQLLAQLADAEGAAEVAGFSVDAPFHSASGRRCRGVRRAAERRLACERTDGAWSFVPNVLRGTP